MEDSDELRRQHGAGLADGDGVIVKADEVDEAEEEPPLVSPTDDEEYQAQFPATSSNPPNEYLPRIGQNLKPPLLRNQSRPVLRREGTAPKPPRQPPPPAPPVQKQQQPQQLDELGGIAESMSLAQLRRIVDLPKLDTTAYAYTYEDTRSFPEELDEWFQYTEEDDEMILRGKDVFDGEWERFQGDKNMSLRRGKGWLESTAADHEHFIESQLAGLNDRDGLTRNTHLECITYLALGAWDESAGLAYSQAEMNEETQASVNEKYCKTSMQTHWIQDFAQILARLNGLQKIYDCIRKICDSDTYVSFQRAPRCGCFMCIILKSDLKFFFNSTYLELDRVLTRRHSDNLAPRADSVYQGLQAKWALSTDREISRGH